MPNLKSAKKRMRQNEVRREENLRVRTRVKSARRSMMEALTAGDAAQGQIAFKDLSFYFRQSCKEGCYCKKYSNTKKNKCI